MNLVPTLRNIWWMAMWSQDLVPGQMLSRRIMDEPLVFYRTENGAPVAVHDRCPHRWAPLSKGKLLPGDHLQCPYHGLEFDQHGVCVNNPHPNYKIPSMMRVRSYPLAEKHSIVWIWMGTGTPDESLIPDFGWLDPEAGNQLDRRAYLPMPCNWRLMVANLPDASHVGMLHQDTLGVPEMVDALAEVEQHGARTVTVIRRSANIPAPRRFELLLFRENFRVDLWSSNSWTAPSCVTIIGGGAAHRDRRSGEWHVYRALPHPETATSCHYYHDDADEPDPAQPGRGGRGDGRTGRNAPPRLHG